MDMYRISVVRDGIRRVMDVDAIEAPILDREATRTGWEVSCVLLPPGVELILGVLVEPEQKRFDS